MKKLLLGTVLFGLLTPYVWGVDYTVSLTGDTNWSGITWTPTGTPGAGDTASVAFSAGGTVTLDSAVSLDAFQMSGAGPLYLNSNTMTFTGTTPTLTLTTASPNQSATVNTALSSTSLLTIAALGDTSDSGNSDGRVTTLSNSANQFAGGVKITSGVLTVGSRLNNSAVTLAGGGFASLNTGSFSTPLTVETTGIMRVWGGTTLSASSTITGSGTLKKTDGGTVVYSGNLSGFSGTFSNRGSGTTQFTGTSLNNSTALVESASSKTLILTDSSANLSGVSVRTKGGTHVTFGGGVNPTSFQSVTYEGGTLQFGNGDAKSYAGDFTWGLSGTTIDVADFNYAGEYTVNAPDFVGNVINVKSGSATLAASGVMSTSTVNVGSATFTDRRNPASVQTFATVNLNAADSVLNVAGTSENARISTVNGNAGTVNLADGFQGSVTTLTAGNGGKVNMQSGATGSVTTLNAQAGSTVTMQTGTTAKIATLSNAGTLTAQSGAAPVITNLHSSGVLTMNAGATPNITNLAISGGTFTDNQGIAVKNMTVSPTSVLNGSKATTVNNTLTVGEVNLSSDTTGGLAITASEAGKYNVVHSGGTLRLSPTVPGLVARYDASFAGNFTTNDSGNVTAWLDSSGMNNTANRNKGGYVTLTPDASVGGNTVASFPTESNWTSFTFSRISDIRTVFWVVKDQSNINPQREGTQDVFNGRFLLGDSSTYNFHRGTVSSTTGDAAYPIFAGYATDGVKRGTITLNGESGTTSSTLENNAWSLLSVQLASGTTATASTISADRGTLQRSWNGSIGEILIFNTRLSDEETQAMNAYLNDKWNLGFTAYEGVAVTDPFDKIDVSDVVLNITGNTVLDTGTATDVSLGTVSVAAGQTLSFQTQAARIQIAEINGLGTVDSSVPLTGVTYTAAEKGTVGVLNFAPEGGVQTFTSSTIWVDMNNDANDLLKVEGDVDLTNALILLKPSDDFMAEFGDTFDLIEATGDITGLADAILDSLGLMGHASGETVWQLGVFGLDGGGNVLRLIAGVPEPASWLLLLLGVCFLKRRKLG